MAEKTKEETPVRWRETRSDEPAGFSRVVRKYTRVVEGIDPPKGAKIVIDEPHDWSEVPA